jgi:hypothetical protein
VFRDFVVTIFFEWFRVISWFQSTFHLGTTKHNAEQKKPGPKAKSLFFEGEPVSNTN